MGTSDCSTCESCGKSYADDYYGTDTFIGDRCNMSLCENSKNCDISFCSIKCLAKLGILYNKETEKYDGTNCQIYKANCEHDELGVLK